MNIEDVVFFLTKINDGFEGEVSIGMPVIDEGRASVEIRINDDLYQIILTQGFFENK
ncbi:hypothetical protein [Sporosarcina sp. FSL K6-3457]|uniref:hypothetical protein n=1 Tax=Sporosarcina sp. FSL K6-3457 TaxID=2978204 RepID=UPI0030F7120F